MRYKVISVSLLVLTIAYAVVTGRYEFLFASAFALVSVIGSFRKRAQFKEATTTPAARMISGEREIREMNVGEGAFTVSWAMVNYENKFYLHGGYTVTEIIRGTSDMLIERHEDGYHVFSSTNGEKYESCNWIPWVGATKADLVPVAAIH